MKRSDLTILLSVIVVGLMAGFWLLVMSPKRDEATQLSDQADQLRTSVQQQEQLVTYAEQARSHFDTDYRHLVVLGKGVPADSDTPSLLVSVQHLADQAHVDFRTIELATDNAAASAPPTTPPALVAPNTSSSSSTATPASGTSGTSTTDTAGTTAPGASTTTSTSTPTSTSTTATSTTATAATADPTEAAAASLPIGATLGSAGLGVMPYTLTFRGGFFQIADFVGKVDELVHAKGATVAVGGRLVTINGFSLAIPTSTATDGSPLKGPPKLEATLAVTTYVTPGDQGLLAGATPGGPPASIPSATPAAAPTTPSTATTPTATASAATATPTANPTP